MWHNILLPRDDRFGFLDWISAPCSQLLYTYYPTMNTGELQQTER
jgi:hypothetical protein